MYKRQYKFNPHSGEIDEVVLYKDAEKAGKIRGWIYSVHVGKMCIRDRD